MLSNNYWSQHARLKYKRGSASEHPCEFCHEKARDWAKRHDRNGQSPDDYIPLCRPCHVLYDNSPAKRNPQAYARGEQIKQARLKEEQVLQIRQRVANGETQASMTREYGVSIDAIYKIVHRITWKHI